MTTIAANLDMMASDLQATQNNGMMMKIKNKMYRFGPDNCFAPGMSFIAGFAGNVDSCMETIDFYSNPDYGRPPRCRDFQILVLTEEKELYYAWTPTKWVRVEGKLHAIGSGSGVAIGAMLAGADPLAAVKAAGKVDSATGLGYKSMKF